MNRESVEKAREIAKAGKNVGPGFVNWLCEQWLADHPEEDE